MYRLRRVHTRPTSTSGDLRKVRVAALPITETAALWGGIKAGIFAERGLEVEVLPAQGGAQAIPGADERRHRLRDRPALRPVPGRPAGPRRRHHRQLRLVLRRRRRHQRRGGLGEVRHHPAGRPGGQTGLGQQPGRGRRRDDHGGGREGRRRPDDRSSSSRSPSRTPRPSSQPATSTPPGCRSPSSPTQGPRRHLRRRALPGGRARPDHAHHHHHQRTHRTRTPSWSRTSPRR